MTGIFTDGDAGFMRQALELARNGEGRVSPNPPVGCLLVKGGEIVGRGWHDRFGDLHAEAMALREAGPRARGALAYVTLSPCVSWGRQPPCAEALIRAGVAGVIAAAVDPNPRNASGIEKLRQAGVAAFSGLLREEAEYLARGFFKSRKLDLPYLTLKYAMTLDGKIASVSGDSRWVSGTESREMVQDMRSRSDVVLIGSGTALADNPRLTVREPVWSARGGRRGHPQPRRVVVDGKARLPTDSAMLRDMGAAGGETLVALSEEADPGRIAALAAAGAGIRSFTPSRDGRVPLDALLRLLCREGANNVLCEGGGELAAGLTEAGLVDEIVVFVAPKLIGGRTAPGPVGGPGRHRLADALALEIRETRCVGPDLLIRAGPPCSRK